MKTIALACSLVLNLILVAALFFSAMQGCAETPTGRIGVLKDDLEVGYFGGNSTVFTLPKGLVVREASATGGDWFEPNRFRLVITSEKDSFVDYSIKGKQSSGQDSEYYSADIRAPRNQQSAIN